MLHKLVKGKHKSTHKMTKTGDGATQHQSHQRQADLCEFKVSLVYSVRFRTARAKQRNSVLKTQNRRGGGNSPVSKVCVMVHTTSPSFSGREQRP